MQNIHVKRTAFVLALSLAGFAAAATPAVAHASRLQEHHDEMRTDQKDHPEYRNNEFYRTGNREGWEDHQRNERRKEHNHKYKTEDDRRAHDYGYEQGWSGTRYDEHR